MWSLNIPGMELIEEMVWLGGGGAECDFSVVRDRLFTSSLSFPEGGLKL